MVLLIDNYDSFVQNLARHLRRLGQETSVVRNDAISVSEIRKVAPAAIVLSPGPCGPQQTGCSLEVVRALAGEIPMLGVCLGHQTIAAAFGGRIVRAPEPMHGRTSQVHHAGSGLFSGLPSPFTACRYHSLVADRGYLPKCLEVSAWTADGIVMGIRHADYLCFGVQFHPEAILTDFGYLLLQNFLHQAGLSESPFPDVATELRPRPQQHQIPAGPVTF